MFKSKVITGVSIATAIVFAFIYFSGCGKQEALADERDWKKAYDSLEHRVKVQLEPSMELAASAADSLHHIADSLTKINNEHEAETIIQYQDVYKRDSVINSLSVLQLSRELTDKFK